MWEWIIGVIVLVPIAWGVYQYNRFIVLRNRIENAFSQIDVQLKRRYDLIPNLVETVKGYAKHERGTFADIAKYRSGLVGKDMNERVAANDMLTQTLGKLMVVMEAYPQLKANENFLKLQEELAGTENKIAYIRMAYNDTVYQFNNETQMLPGSLIAGMMGLTQKQYPQIGEEEKRNVQVKFGEQKG